MCHLDCLHDWCLPAEERFELSDQAVIPPPALRLVAHGFDRPFMGKSFSVGTVSRQSVVDICHLQDTRRESNLLALQAIGISRTIQFFVMVPNNGQNQTERLQRSADPLACDWMLLHNGPLLFIEGTRFDQDMFGDAYLADVMDDSAPPQRNTLFLRQTETASQGLGEG